MLRHLIPPVPTLVVGVVATMTVLSSVPSLQPGPNSLIAPNGQHLGIGTAGSNYATFTTYQPPELWSGGSPVEACSACDLQSLTKTPQGQSTRPGQPVNAATGGFTESVPLFSIPEPGGSMDATMTYDSYRAQSDIASGGSPASIEWGWGWQSSLSAYLTPGLAPMVTEENGAEVNFTYAPSNGVCPLGDYSDPAKYTGVDSAFQFCAPYRVNAQLSELTTNGNITGWHLFEDGGRTVLTFNAAGQLTDVGTLSNFDAETYLYGQTNQTNSACPSNGTTIFVCTVITDRFGRQIVIEQDVFGQVVGMLDPMGRLYSWIFQPNSSYVASIANPDGTTSFTYTSSLGSPFSADMQTITDPNNYTRHIGYNLTGQVASITDFADLDTTYYSYQGSCSDLSCTGPGDDRTTTVTYPDGETDTDYFYEGLLVTDTWGTSSSGLDQSQVNYIYGFPPADPQDQDDNISLAIEWPPTDGVVFTVTTDAVGNVITVTDVYGDTVTNEYNDFAGSDLNELCWTVHVALSAQQPDVSCGNTPPTGAASYQYDSNGNVTSSTDYLGHTTRYAYYYSSSALNDLPCWVAAPTVTGTGSNCTTSPSGNAPTDSTAYSYDSYGDVSMVNEAYGDATWETTSTSTYDANGELTSSLPPDAYSRGTNPGSGNSAYETVYGLDGDGREVYLYAPGPESSGNEITNYGYDPVGNVTTVDNLSDGAVTTNAYDGDSRLCWTYQGTAPINNTSCTRPTGATGNYYSYDTTALAYTTNPNGNTTSYSYGDPAFPTEATEVSDPMAASVVVNLYNQLGSVCSTGPYLMPSCQWEQGNTYDGYDLLNRLTGTIDPSGNITTYGYTNTGYPELLTSQTNEALSQVTSYTYDADGKQIQISGAAPNSVTQVGYDADGRLCFKVNVLSLAGCTNFPTSTGDSGYSYNPLNQLQTMTDYGLGTSSFSYDNSGNLLQETNDNGQVTTYAYDVANEVTCVGYSVAANPNCANPGSSTNTVVDYGYQYIGKISDTLDWLGNETHYGYTADGELNLTNVSYPSGTGETINYGYDAANNLTTGNYAGPAVGTQSQSWTPNGDSLVSATSQLGSYNSSPTYDGVHNWVASATNPGASGADSYQYNFNGELFSDLAPNGLGPYYAYNGADEPTSEANTNTGVVSTFAYNANGQRCWSAPTNVSNPSCSSPPSGATSYAWNAYGQLCWTGNTTSTNSCSSPPSGSNSYQYDGTDLRSTATTGPVTAWSAPSTIDSRSLSGVSCPTSSFCMAVDGGGYAVKYNGSSWASAGDIDSTRVLNNISCTSSTFCMAIDDSGYAIKYNGSSWSVSHIDGSQQLLSISCVSSTFCVAGDGAGHELTYSGSTWAKTTLESGNSVQGVSCTSTSFCMAIDGSGRAFKYNGSAWSGATTIDTRPTTGISCASTSFCAVVDFDGYAITYNGSAWSSPHSIDGTHILISVSCTSSAFCQTTDTVGDALIYNGTTWSRSDIDGSSYLASVSCQSTTFCEAVDGAGHALAYQPTTVTSHFSWDVVSGGGLPRLLTDGTNAYVYGPTLFGGSAPVEQISLSTHTPEYFSSIPSGVQLVFGASGSLINQSSYSTYGTQTNTSSSGAATPFGFQGGYTDPTGLIYLINRYYDPTTSQFLSVDPMNQSTGQPYLFGGDNPVNAGDPSGLASGYLSINQIYLAFSRWHVQQAEAAAAAEPQVGTEAQALAGLESWLYPAGGYAPSSNNPFLWALFVGSISAANRQAQAVANAQDDYMCGGPCLSLQQQAINDYTSDETQFIISPAALAQASADAGHLGRVFDCLVDGAAVAGGGLELGAGDLIWASVNKAGVSVSAGFANGTAGIIGFGYGCVGGTWPY